MLNKFIWTASKLSIATLIAVGSMLSVGSFAQDNEFVEEVVSIDLVQGTAETTFDGIISNFPKPNWFNLTVFKISPVLF